MKIAVILGSPAGESFGRELAETYRRAAAAAGAEVDVVDLAELVFDPELKGDLSHSQTLEPDLVRAQAVLGRADRWVLVYPNWWGTYPARMKGFLDRILLPGFAFRYREGSSIPEKLLAGKSARLLVTMDGPGWWYRWSMGRGGDRALLRSVFWFCGIRPAGVHYADRLRPRASAPRDQHRRLATRLGTLDAALA